jgi:hypothetical protein
MRSKPRSRAVPTILTALTLLATTGAQVGCASSTSMHAQDEQRALVLEELGLVTSDLDPGWSTPRRAPRTGSARPTLLAGDWIALGWARLDSSIFGARAISTDRATFATVFQTFYE